MYKLEIRAGRKHPSLILIGDYVTEQVKGAIKRLVSMPQAKAVAAIWEIGEHETPGSYIAIDLRKGSPEEINEFERQARIVLGQVTPRHLLKELSFSPNFEGALFYITEAAAEKKIAYSSGDWLRPMTMYFDDQVQRREFIDYWNSLKLPQCFKH